MVNTLQYEADNEVNSMIHRQRIRSAENFQASGGMDFVLHAFEQIHQEGTKSMESFAHEVESGSRNLPSISPRARKPQNGRPRTRRIAENDQDSPSASCRAAFERADMNGDGVLTREEFEVAFQSGAFEDHLQGVDMNPQSRTTYIDEAPGHPDGWDPTRSRQNSISEARRLAEARKRVADDALIMVARQANVNALSDNKPVESAGQELVVVDDAEVKRQQQILKRGQEAEEQRRTEERIRKETQARIAANLAEVTAARASFQESSLLESSGWVCRWQWEPKLLICCRCK